MNGITNGQVIDKILAYHPFIEGYNGCDCIKIGNAQDECRGVAVCLEPSMDNVRAARDKNLNLMIVHEPLFYQTPDYGTWRGGYSNSVYEYKKTYIEQNGITIFRDHDHMHFHRPDSIFSGVIRELGWENYYQGQEKSMCYVFDFAQDAMKLSAVAEHLRDALSLNGVKYIGNPDMIVHKAALVGHLFPNCFYPDGEKDDGFYHDYSMDVIREMEMNGVELIIPGEIIEWTCAAYIRDAFSQGRNVACLNIGHYNLEELGMKDFAKVVSRLVEYKVPVEYIKGADTFSFMKWKS